MVMADRIEPRTLFSPDDVANYIGAGYFIWETADANANLLELLFPEGGAVDVPAFVIGDASIAGIDLGASGIDISGLTEPSLVIVNDAKDAYVRLDAGDDAVAGSQGLYFHPAADEDVEIINIGVTGTPRLYWNEAATSFHFSDLIYTEQGITIQDDKMVTLGASGDIRMLYETADSDARVALFLIDESGNPGNNVPAFVFGEYDNLYNVNLGLFDTVTEPIVTVVDLDADSYIGISFGSDDVPEIRIGGNADFGNSTKDPRAVLPDDWARFNIGGIAYYSPLYLVS